MKTHFQKMNFHFKNEFCNQCVLYYPIYMYMCIYSLQVRGGTCIYIYSILYRLEVVQRNLGALKQEHQTVTEMHDMLRRHNETLKQQHDV